jgi:hypothetical protein
MLSRNALVFMGSSRQIRYSRNRRVAPCAALARHVHTSGNAEGRRLVDALSPDVFVAVLMRISKMGLVFDNATRCRKSAVL